MEGPQKRIYTQREQEGESAEYKEHWAKQAKMLERWDTVNGQMFVEAIEDAKTVEDLINAVKVCAVKDERTAEDKVIPRFSGGFSMAKHSQVAGDILDSSPAYRIVNAIKAAQDAFKRGSDFEFKQQTNSLSRELGGKLEEILKKEHPSE